MDMYEAMLRPTLEDRKRTRHDATVDRRRARRRTRSAAADKATGTGCRKNATFSKTSSRRNDALAPSTKLI